MGGHVSGPLDGIKVVEWAHLHMGPGGGVFLADMGADVIHVEQRVVGDSMRHVDTMWGVDFTLPHDRNVFTEDLLRNKRSLAVDLSTDEGIDIVHRLVREADVFISNMRAKTIERARMDYETLSAFNPRLVYCHGTAFGPEGPDADAPGNEILGLARAGLMLGSAPDGGEPIYPTVGLNDRLGAIGVAFGVLGALVARERSGVGQLVETSLLGWMVNLQAIGAEVAANTQQDPRPPRRGQSNNPLYNYYRCGDGTWVALGMLVHTQQYWPALCDALGVPALATDVRFLDDAAREANRDELVAILDARFADVTFEQWDRAVKAYDLIATRVNSLPDLVRDPQVLANEYLVERPHPELGSFWYAQTPVRYHRTPVSVRSATPHCGQDTVAVLRAAGYDDDEIEALIDGAIAGP